MQLTVTRMLLLVRQGAAIVALWGGGCDPRPSHQEHSSDPGLLVRLYFDLDPELTPREATVTAVNHLHNAASIRIGEAVLELLKARQVLVHYDAELYRRWIGELDLEIRQLVVLKCGETLMGYGPDPSVMELPIEEMFPLEWVERASIASCGALIAERQFRLGRLRDQPWHPLDAGVDASSDATP